MRLSFAFRFAPCLGIAFLVLAVVDCSGSDGASASLPAGTERGPCREGGVCDPGLECRSDLCVESSTGGGGSGTGGVSSGGSGNGAGGVSSGGSATGGAAIGGTGGEMDASSDSFSSTTCRGSHPNVDVSRRFCDPGSCYCTDPFDTCFEGTVAAACCNVAPLCGDTEAERGIVCEATHPIIGPPRTCETGYCLCSDGQTVDACYPESVARACCPPQIDIACVP